MKNYLLFSFILLLSLSSCRKDIIEIDEVIVPPEVTQFVESSIIGVVAGPDQAPISNALIEVGSFQTFTNEQGIFYISTEFLRETEVVKISKNDYCTNYRTLQPQVGVCADLSIQLLKRESKGSFDAVNGGMVSFDEQSILVFKPNSIALNDNSKYLGRAETVGAYLDFYSDEVSNLFPGNFLGIDAEGNRKSLGTFGAVAFDLIGENGESLKIAENSNATIVFPIPAELSAIAPAMIPLWNFDEVSGLWMEKGEAILEGNQYFAKVDAVSFWSISIPFEAIDLSGQLVFENEIPFKDCKVQLYTDGIIVQTFMTNQTGHFDTSIPKNQHLRLKIWSADCQEIIHEQDLGMFDSETNVAPILVSNSTKRINGTIRNCTGDILNDGFVMVRLNDAPHPLIATDGSFDYSYTFCDQSFIDVQAFDGENNLSSELYRFPTQENLDLSILRICNAEISFADIAIGNSRFACDAVNVNVVGESTQLSCAGPGGSFAMQVNGTATGTHAVEQFSFNNQPLVCNNLNVTFSQINIFSGKVVGTISGQLTDNNGQSHPIIGTFMQAN